MRIDGGRRKRHPGCGVGDGELPVRPGPQPAGCGRTSAGVRRVAGRNAADRCARRAARAAAPAAASAWWMRPAEWFAPSMAGPMSRGSPLWDSCSQLRTRRSEHGAPARRVGLGGADHRGRRDAPAAIWAVPDEKSAPTAPAGESVIVDLFRETFAASEVRPRARRSGRWYVICWSALSRGRSRIRRRRWGRGGRHTDHRLRSSPGSPMSGTIARFSLLSPSGGGDRPAVSESDRSCWGRPLKPCGPTVLTSS